MSWEPITRAAFLQYRRSLPSSEELSGIKFDGDEAHGWDP